MNDMDKDIENPLSPFYKGKRKCPECGNGILAFVWSLKTYLKCYSCQKTFPWIKPEKQNINTISPA
jgi:uncharacterized protein (DUF983 family)